MKIQGKILSIIMLMGVMLIGLAGAAIYGITQYNTSVEKYENLSLRKFYGERATHLASLVALDSRGIYLAASTQAATPFGNNILRYLLELDNVVNTQWKPLLPADDAREMERFQQMSETVNTFLTFRRELVRLGTQVSPAEAAVLGNNQENRQNRQALQRLMESMNEENLTLVTQLQEENNALYSTIFWSVIIFAAIALIGGIAAAYYTARQSIVKPLEKIIDTIGKLQSGQFDVEMDTTKRSDEIGTLWHSVSEFKQTLEESKSLREKQKDTEIQQSEIRKRDMQQLAADFETNIGSIIETVNATALNLNKSADEMSMLASSASEQVVSVSAAAEQASTNVQMVAGASEELSSTIAEVSTQITSTSQLAEDAANEAASTTASVEELRNVVNRVSAFTSMISEIAEKTNLLALNATIEAARAGEAGRGFAVVASEVKQLAQQTAKATEEITRQMKDMETVASSSIDAVIQISQKIDNINQTAGAIAAAAEEQGAATSEIARSVSDVATGTASVSASITHVSNVVDKTGKMSKEVSQSSNMLNKQAEELTAQVRAFLNRVRAA